MRSPKENVEREQRISGKKGRKREPLKRKTRSQKNQRTGSVQFHRHSFNKIIRKVGRLDV